MATFYLGICFTLGFLFSSVTTQDATVVYRIMEENQPKHYIGSVAIDSQLFNDISAGDFQHLQFQIIKEQNSYVTLFQIESNTSLLWTSQTIDREELTDCFQECIIKFNVAVFDLNMFEMIHIIRVMIDIQDANDNAPQFSLISNPIQISEAVSIGSVIASGVAIDRDTNKINAVQTYILLPEMDPPVFELVVTESKEFELVTNIALDREKVSEYNLVIKAIDGGSVPLSATIDLTIEVIDANDNAPTFAQESYSVSVKENAVMNKVILTFSATDPDIGDNGQIKYAFSNRVSDKVTDLFYIDSETGELSIVGTIDYEIDQRFGFHVVAYDLGVPPQTSTARVDINIEDVNDNSPVINLNQPPGGTTLSESSKNGTFIAHVEIFDIDSGNNGIVLCTIMDTTFKLERIDDGSNYKVVLNKSLDHDVKPQHNVTILCQDMGDLPRQTVANFILHVEDVNDHTPVFTESTYTAVITENNQIGKPIIRISATDKDSGLNGQIIYTFEPDVNKLFVLDPDTGVITANISLDRETHGDRLEYQVIAVDKGEPARTATGTVVINIYDVNDNDPVFDNETIELYVLENLEVGSTVGNISVSDPDKDVNGTFRLIFPKGDEIMDYFKFEQSGLVTTKKVLDREFVALHQCLVHAVDMGGRTSTAEVTIHVVDINDNRPEIIYPNEYDNTIELPVTHTSGSLVLQIEARDYDTGNNSLLHFNIIKDNSSGAFTMDGRTGHMFLNKSIDENIGDIYTLDIDVRDAGVPPLNTSVTINIQIVPAMYHASPLSSGLTVNLGIVLGIVLLTIVLATTMIIIILKTFWNDKQKKKQNEQTKIIQESKEVNLKFDSLASRKSSSNEPKDTAMEKNVCPEVQIDGTQPGYPDIQPGHYDSLNETGYLTNSSTTSVTTDRLYIEQPKTSNTDDVGSDDVFTHDSGQGGSVTDLNITTESPGYHSLERHHSLKQMGRPNGIIDRYSTGSVHNLYSACNNTGPSMALNTPLSKSMAVFTTNEKKTAERKELSKLYKIQKRVMFSDDLEHVNYNDIFKSITMLTASVNDYYTHSKLNTDLNENMTQTTNLTDTPDTISSDCWMV